MADEDVDATAQVWAIKMGGEVLPIQDLPLAIIDRVARANSVTWPEVVLSPCANLSVAMGLLDATAEHLGTTAPVNLTVKTLLPFFEQVPDDVPESKREPEPEEAADPFASNG